MSLAIAQHLHLHVPRPRDEALQVDARIAEGGAGLRRRQFQRGVQVLPALDQLHAAAAATAHRLDEQRQSDAARQRLCGLARGHRAARRHRHARRLGRGARRELVARGRELRGCRADEDDAVLLAHLRQLGPLGQKAVAGMNGIAA